jgi:zinc protease
MKRLKSLIIILMISVAVSLNAADLKVSGELEQGILENGLTYYIYQNEKPQDKAYLSLVINSGSLNEDEDQLGLAHFIEHMAFNGTENYPGNMLVKYLQSIGMNFGADLNAFTGFDRTIFKLQVPTNKPEEFENSFEVLREWATGITFLPKDTQEEKGVVLEEWRLRQGLSKRLSDTQKKAVYGESRYAERFPIGDPEIIKNTTPELLKRYYKKWYRPENMAVIAVGDFDKNQVKNFIEKYFNYKSSTDFQKVPVYKVGKSNGEITIFKDVEITGINFDILTKTDLEPIKNKESYKKYVIEDIYNNILQSRFDRISQKGSPTIINGYSYSVNIGKYDMVNVAGAFLKDENIEDGIYEIFRQMKKLAVNGPTPYEVNAEKAELNKAMQMAYKNRDSVEHSQIATEIQASFLEGDIFTEIENQMEIFDEIMEEISIEDIQKKAQELYQNENKTFFLTAPDKKSITVPSKEDIKLFIKNIKSEKLAEEKEIFKEKTLSSNKFESGEIVKITKEKDFSRYKLSNNIEVLLKETNFDKDRILIKLFSKGGSSLMDEKGYIASRFASQIIASSGIGNLSPVETDLFMKGKNIQFSPYILDYVEGIDIETDKEDLETTMKVLKAFLTEAKVEKNIYNNFMDTQKQYLENRENSPNVIYSDKINETLSQNHPRRKPLTIEELEQLEEKDLLEAFKDRFSDIGDFQVVIVGSTKDTGIEDLIKKYLAGIPGKKIIETPKDLGVKFPKGIVKETVKKGTDKKVSVSLNYPYRGTYTYENRVKYLGTAKILDMILLEEIREKIGGIYTIYADTDLNPLNYGENQLSINYSTDPEKADEVTEAIKKVVQDCLNGKFEDRILDSIIENYTFNYDSILRKNEFWIDYLSKRELFGDNFTIYSPSKYKRTINRTKMTEFMNYAIDTENYVEVRLVPEKSE